MVPKARLEPRFDIMPASVFSGAFERVLNDPAVSMAYGRFNVRRADFWNEALIISYRIISDQNALQPSAGSG